MANINLSNFGQLEGRLTRDIKTFDNQDGSKKVMVNIAVTNNYKNKEGKRDSQFINLQGFVSKDIAIDKSVYAYMHKGDLVKIGFEVRSNNYEKDGEMVYDQILFITQVELKETKKSQEARGVATMPAEFAEEMDEEAF